MVFSYRSNSNEAATTTFPSTSFLLMLCAAIGRVTSQASAVPLPPGPKIVGGSPATDTQFPWASFGRVLAPGGQSLEACSGSLVFDYSGAECTTSAQCRGEPCVANVADDIARCQATWVVTAAHCLVHGFGVVNNENIPNFAFGRSDWSSSSGVTKADCTEIYVHEGFVGDPDNYNDIALCKLGSVLTSMKRTVILDAGTDTLTSRELVTAAGWGRVQDSADAPVQSVLRYVNLHSSTNAECQADITDRSADTKNYALAETQLCAGGNTFGDDGKDTCQGDSGGPLFLQYSDTTPLLLGLTSFGWKCAAGPPAIYTRTAQFKSWIKSKQTCSREFATAGRCSNSCIVNPRSGAFACSVFPTQAPVTPTTRRPTAKPTTRAPTLKPTTRSPVPRPTTKAPVPKPTRPPTIAPTTKRPTAKPTTRSPTAKPTTRKPTPKPTTRKPTPKPTTRKPTPRPTTRSPTARPTQA